MIQDSNFKQAGDPVFRFQRGWDSGFKEYDFLDSYFEVRDSGFKLCIPGPYTGLIFSIVFFFSELFKFVQIHEKFHRSHLVCNCKKKIPLKFQKITEILNQPSLYLQSLSHLVRQWYFYCRQHAHNVFSEAYFVHPWAF